MESENPQNIRTSQPGGNSCDHEQLEDIPSWSDTRTERPNDSCGDHEEYSLSGPLFSPPLYIQRYMMVYELLKMENITSVVDFGCAECSLYRYIKPVTSLERIVCVDVDKELLQHHKWKIKPLNCDYLISQTKPLSVEIYQGSVCEYDERLAGVEACVLVELIEHLEADILESLPQNVFGNLRPRIVFVSTPNSEYNVLFKDFSGTRHWDHKFEWTQQQFKDWCDLICDKYNYTVTLTGVGLPPDDQQELGFCTQAAIFKLNHIPPVKKEGRFRQGSNPNNVVFTGQGDTKTTNTDTSEGPCLPLCGHCDDKKRSCHCEDQGPYVLINHVELPYKKPVPINQQIQYEISYYGRMLAADADSDNEDEGYPVSIETLYSFSKIKSLCESIDQLRIHIAKSDFSLSQDKNSVIVPIDQDNRGRWFSYADDEAADYDDSEDNKEDVNSGSTDWWKVTNQTQEDSWDVEPVKDNSDACSCDNKETKETNSVDLKTQTESENLCDHVSKSKLCAIKPISDSC